MLWKFVADSGEDMNSQLQNACHQKATHKFWQGVKQNMTQNAHIRAN